MITSGWQNVVKCIYVISKEGENNKCYVKVCILYVKNSIKLSASPFLVMLKTFLLEEHSKDTPRPLQGHLGTQTLEGHFSTRRTLEEHSNGTWALKALRHSKGT